MRRLVSLAATTALLSACTVGPSYDGPPPVGSAATQRGHFARAGDAALVAAPGVARWWEGLGDPTLTRLVDEALAQSPQVEIAQGRIREARAKLDQGRANLLPNISATAIYAHARLPGTGIGNSDSGSGEDNGGDDASAVNFYNIGATASWEPDIFGAGRRRVSAARATVEQRYADLADAQVALSAQVAQTYANLRDAQERTRLNALSSEKQRRSLDLTRQRYAAGTASRLMVERLQTQKESTDAQNIPLSAQVAMYKDALAVLTGRVPGELDAMLGDSGPVPAPPAQVPIGDPAALIAQRPDIRSAERALAASTENIGVQKARMFPGISFTGILGLGGTRPGDVFDPDKLAALLIPQLMWPILDFGRIKGAVREAEGQRDTAQGQYRQTVLAALQDAEDSLARFGATRQQLAGLIRSQRSAGIAATLNRQRFEAGTSTLIDQLDIERQELSAISAVSQARAQLTIDYIAVQKALGLGWTAPDGGQKSQDVVERGQGGQ